MRDILEFIGAISFGLLAGFGIFLICIGQFDAGLGSVICVVLIAFIVMESSRTR